MADNVTLNSMSGGAVVATDEVTDATLGTVQVQYVKLMDGTLNSTTKISPATSAKQDSIITALGSPFQAGGSIGNTSFGISGTLPAFASAPTVLLGQTGADGSTTIATGGTAQNLFSGATPTNGFEICNPDASEDLWVSDSTTAAANATGCYRVAANGGTYTTPAGYKPIGAVSIVGATTGHKITARKW